MAAEKNKAGGEGLRLVMLTAFFTSGLFLLLTLVFQLYLNPLMEKRAQSAMKGYDQLKTLLLSPQTIEFRQQAKLSAGSEGGDLRGIITKKLPIHALSYENFPGSKSKSAGGVKILTQRVDLQAADLPSVLSFVADVAQAKKTIRVQKVDLGRPSRGREQDSWTADVTFVDYETPEDQ